MGQVGLGRLFNLATSATTAEARVSLANAAGVTFVLIGATSGDATIEEHDASTSGDSNDLARTLTYYTQASGVWTERTGGAGTGVVTAQTGGLLAVYVDATWLTDGYKWVSATHASGSFVYIIHDLHSQRTPQNLAAILT